MLTELKTVVPDWTEDCGGEPRGRDFLGLQSVGERILNDLLPGMTNSTVHPRYYAFFSWVFKLASDLAIHPGAALSQHQFQYETALIYAAQAEHSAEIRNVVGIRDARTGSHRWTGESRNYELYQSNWSNRISAFSSANYRPSFANLRLLRANSNGTVSLLPEGKLLAQSFESQLAGSAALRTLAKAVSLSRSVRGTTLKKLHDEFCPCAVRNRTGTERAALVEVLFRFERPSQHPIAQKEEESRRLSLAYMLDLVRKCGQTPWDEDELRTLIYFWQSSVKPYVPEPGLRRVAELWRVFQAEQYERFALETLWAAFLRMLNQHIVMPFNLADVGTEIAAELSRSQFYEGLGVRLPVSLSKMTLENFAAGVLKAGTPRLSADSATFFEESWSRFGHTAKTSETAWVSEIHDALENTGNAYSAFGAAVGLLVTLWLRWRRFDVAASGAGLLKIGGRLRLSLTKVMADLDSRRDDPLPNVFSWLIEEYVVGQHLRVAAQKLALEGLDTFWFCASEDGYRIHPERDVSKSAPAYSGSKLWAARSCLHDLNLIEIRPDSSSRCTREGIAVVGRVLKSTAAR